MARVSESSFVPSPSTEALTTWKTKQQTKCFTGESMHQMANFKIDSKGPSPQDATTNDELDQKDGVMEENVRNALDAYSPPCLLPMGFEVPESGSMALSGSTQPLLP
nr:CSC1-like protein At3g54510 isoform X1 [Ipomoea batatas]GME14085.1 CSC1-like protein At3g54510 isoform X1 [Ipomoea batatas]